MTLMIRPAVAADLCQATRLLEAANLPVADLSAENLALIAENNELIQGVIGLESFGEVAFLRSLAVSAGARGSGIGAALVTALEVQCTADGVRDLWLLTIDGDAFFAKLGYELHDRADAPDTIRGTEEFAGLCPSNAVLMLKHLQHR